MRSNAEDNGCAARRDSRRCHHSPPWPWYHHLDAALTTAGHWPRYLFIGLDWAFLFVPTPASNTDLPSLITAPASENRDGMKTKKTNCFFPSSDTPLFITTHNIANVSTAASITMSDSWSLNTFIGHRVGKLLFPFAKSHKLNVYLRPAWRWSVHCASWQSFSQRSDLGPAPPALRSPAAATMTGGRAALLCVVKWRIELSTQFHDI